MVEWIEVKAPEKANLLTCGRRCGCTERSSFQRDDRERGCWPKTLPFEVVCNPRQQEDFHAKLFELHSVSAGWELNRSVNSANACQRVKCALSQLQNR